MSRVQIAVEHTTVGSFVCLLQDATFKPDKVITLDKSKVEYDYIIPTAKVYFKRENEGYAPTDQEELDIKICSMVWPLAFDDVSENLLKELM